MCQIIVVGACIALTLASGFAGDVSVEKREFFRYGFKGTISDISLYGAETNRQILILAQANGVLLDEQKQIVKKLSFITCADTKAFHTRNGRCVLYCPGGGFSPVWASDLDGHEVWRYTATNKVSQSEVYTVVPDLQGRFYVCSFVRGVRILDSSGNQIGNLEDDISDIWFADEKTAFTIRAGRGGGRYMELRDELFKVVRSAPIAKSAFSIVAYNWPQTNDICYSTYTHLIRLGPDLQEKTRIALGGQSTDVQGAIVHDDRGGTYLAVVARHKTGTRRATLLVINREFKAVYKETLPTSMEVSTLGRTNRFYVGVGSTSVREYELKATP